MMALIQWRAVPQEETAGPVRSVKPMLWELVKPRMGRVGLGLLVVMIGRAASLALPASTRYLVDDIIVKRNIQMLAPLVIFVFAAALVQAACSFAVTNIVSKEVTRW